MAVSDSILGQYVSLTLVMEDGSTGLTDSRVMSEVSKFDAEWMPSIYKKQPAGAATQHQQLTGGYYKVTMTADQMGGGFLALAKRQHQAAQSGSEPPKIVMTRTIQTAGGWTYQETFMHGVITSAKNSQGEGNKPLTTDITIEFEDMA